MNNRDTEVWSDLFTLSVIFSVIWFFILVLCAIFGWPTYTLKIVVWSIFGVGAIARILIGIFKW